MTLSFNSSSYTSVFATVPARETFPASLVMIEFPVTVTEIRMTVYLYTAQFTASAFIVRYRQDDFKATGALASATDQHTPGLSTGAKVGIGVGAALAVVALLVLGFLVYRRRQKRTVTSVPPQDDRVTKVKAELHNETVQPKELPAHGYREVNPRDPAELAAYR